MPQTQTYKGYTFPADATPAEMEKVVAQYETTPQGHAKSLIPQPPGGPDVPAGPGMTFREGVNAIGRSALHHLPMIAGLLAAPLTEGMSLLPAMATTGTAAALGSGARDVAEHYTEGKPISAGDMSLDAATEMLINGGGTAAARGVGSLLTKAKPAAIQLIAKAARTDPSTAETMASQGAGTLRSANTDLLDRESMDPQNGKVWAEMLKDAANAHRKATTGAVGDMLGKAAVGTGVGTAFGHDAAIAGVGGVVNAARSRLVKSAVGNAGYAAANIAPSKLDQLFKLITGGADETAQRTIDAPSMEDAIKSKLMSLLGMQPAPVK